MNNFLIEVYDLWKGYDWGTGRLEVLKGLELKVEAGRKVTILGASGVGKSTLLHLLGGLDKPDRGIYRFGGQEIFQSRHNYMASFRNQKVGFIFQFHHLLPEFSALENVIIPGLIGGLAPDEVTDRAVASLTELGLADRMGHRPGELSGGEQQRVAIARALIMNPPLLLADEPTGNLDRKTGDQVMRIIDAQAEERSLTVIMVTHNNLLADRMSTVYLMDEGKLFPR